jgi:hypothetical protein
MECPGPGKQTGRLTFARSAVMVLPHDLEMVPKAERLKTVYVFGAALPTTRRATIT